MAVMIPEQPAHNASNAELWMFGYLKTLPDEWYVLHSLGSVRHDAKPWSEIDFTVVGPLGVLLFEVKGGAVHRTGGTWFVRTGDGRVESLGRGPVHQVGGSEAATRRFLHGRMSSLTRSTFGFAVAFPDCRFEIDDLSVDRSIVFDARDIRRPAFQVVEGFLRWWRERLGHRDALSRAQIVDIVRALVGDVPMAPDLRRVAQDVHERMRLLTVEQERAANELSENPAVWVSGPAGAGKTLLALAAAKSVASEGRRTLLVCHTPALARQSATALQGLPSLTVATFDDLIANRVRPGETFEVVVVDEAQDLLNQTFTDYVDNHLDGGLDHGIWRVFLDPNQGLFGDIDQPSRDRWLAVRPAMHRLSLNCRTTRPISITTSALSQVPFAPGGVELAPNPVLEFLADSSMAMQGAVQAVNAFINQGLSPDEVALLWPEAPAAVQPGSAGFRSELLRGIADGVHTVPIGEFKGLEATAVVIAGVPEVRSREIRKQLYVGCTRATAFLSVFLPAASRQQIVDDYAQIIRDEYQG